MCIKKLLNINQKIRIGIKQSEKKCYYKLRKHTLYFQRMFITYTILEDNNINYYSIEYFILKIKTLENLRLYIVFSFDLSIYIYF